MKPGERRRKIASYRLGDRLVQVEGGEVTRIHPEGTAHGGLAKLPKRLRSQVK